MKCTCRYQEQLKKLELRVQQLEAVKDKREEEDTEWAIKHLTERIVSEDDARAVNIINTFVIKNRNRKFPEFLFDD